MWVCFQPGTESKMEQQILRRAQTTFKVTQCAPSEVLLSNSKSCFVSLILLDGVKYLTSVIKYQLHTFNWFSGTVCSMSPSSLRCFKTPLTVITCYVWHCSAQRDTSPPSAFMIHLFVSKCSAETSEVLRDNLSLCVSAAAMLRHGRTHRGVHCARFRSGRCRGLMTAGATSDLGLKPAVVL